MPCKKKKKRKRRNWMRMGDLFPQGVVKAINGKQKIRFRLIMRNFNVWGKSK